MSHEETKNAPVQELHIETSPETETEVYQAEEAEPDFEPAEASAGQEPERETEPSLAAAIAQALEETLNAPQEEESPERQMEPGETQPGPQSRRAAAAPKQTARRGFSKFPGTNHKKLPKARVPMGPVRYIGEMLGDIRRRQLEALPGAGESLRKQEKRLSKQYPVEQMLSYVRYGIIVLMIFCLMGRTYTWMTLGFMGGLGGVYTTLVLAVAAMLISWQSALRAIRDPWYLRFSYESLLLITTILSVAETAGTKNQETLLPLLVISWCCAGLADQMNNQASLQALRGTITARNRKGIRVAREKWEKTDCIGKAPASLSGFVRHQAQPDVFHAGYSAFSLLFLFVCMVASAYLSGKTQKSFLRILTTLLTIGMPVSAALCCARPYALLSRVLSGLGAVSGWYGMKGLWGNKAVMIYDNDLFPQAAVSHKGIRVYGRMEPRLLTSYGASVMLETGIGLDSIFTRLLREVGGERLTVSHLHTQESGAEGYIKGALVQVGSCQYMQLMGISIPPHSPQYGVYLAVDQKLEAMFDIRYQVAGGASAGFHRFVREPQLKPLLVTRNFCVNPAFVEKWFHAPIASLFCPKAQYRRWLSEPSQMIRGMTCGYVYREGIAAYSRTVAGGRRVYRTGRLFTLLSLLLSSYLTVKTILALSGGGTVLAAQRLLLIQFCIFLLIELGARVAVRK